MAREFPVRYVERPGEGTLSLYYLNQRTDLAYAALPLIERMLRARTFEAQAAVDWLGHGFVWKDVEPVLQGLVGAGILQPHEG